MRPRDEERIKNEEAIRAKVQSEFAQRQKSSRLWAFLNSALGIWVLSAIVVGTLSWAYAQWQGLRQRAEMVHKLDIEMDARLSNVEYSIISHTPPIDKMPYYPVQLLLLPPGPQNAIQPEFANRNLKSLLYELKAELPIEERYELSDILLVIRDLEASSMDKQMNVLELLSFEEKVHDLRDRRWGLKMANRDYASYQNPIRLFPYWLPEVLLRTFLLVVLVSTIYVVYRSVRRWRRRTE
jgi:hypothetical protein